MMVKVGSLFTQVLSLINRYEFDHAVRPWQAERAAKAFAVGISLWLCFSVS